jgi:hypothetical protein
LPGRPDGFSVGFSTSAFIGELVAEDFRAFVRLP